MAVKDKPKQREDRIFTREFVLRLALQYLLTFLITGFLFALLEQLS